MRKVKLTLRPANNQELAVCESLTRSNMSAYLATRKIPWDTARFVASWAAFENLLIMANSQVVGLLRLLPEQDAMGLRDIQLVPEQQGYGVGSWAIQQAQAIAASRGFQMLQLRVYEENPAKALYARLGFKIQSSVDGTIQMVCELPPNQALKLADFSSHLVLR